VSEKQLPTVSVGRVEFVDIGLNYCTVEVGEVVDTRQDTHTSRRQGTP